jgi:hypothetical protein
MNGLVVLDEKEEEDIYSFQVNFKSLLTLPQVLREARRVNTS